MNNRRIARYLASGAFVAAVVASVVALTLAGDAPWAAGQSAKRVVVPGVARDASGGATASPTASPTSTATATGSPSVTATATPTATPTSTPTPTPTASPTASPTQQPGGCTTVCSRKTTLYTDESGTWVVGEIVNLRPSAIEFVTLNVDLLNAGGSVVDSAEAYPDVVVFPAGGDGPFVAFFPGAAGAAGFRVTVLSYDEPASEPPVTGVTVSLNAAFIDEFGGYVVSGRATNTSGVTYLDVAVIVALYDAAGNVIRSDFNYVDGDGLAPGQGADFEIIFDPAPLAVAATRTWVEGVRPE
ncbi:MAG: FxLYD domain-containing protein [Dehalococcoidia bacterium]